MTLLITGFEPFGGETINPSSAVLPALARLPGVHTRVLPVEFVGARRALLEALETVRPSEVLLLGEAGGRTDISLEHVALNWADARIPDHAGQQPRDQKLFEHGPEARFSSLPLRELERTIAAQGVAVSVSYSAGTYVCNALLYAALHALEGSPTRAGFIHLPYLPQQVQGKPGVACMALEAQVQALRAVIGALEPSVHRSSAPTSPIFDS